MALSNPLPDLSPAFVAEFGCILKKTNAANEVLDEAMQCLERHKLSYRMSSVSCKFFLPHKNNRGGLMLSGHNAHRTAARIQKCGAQLSQLHNAMAVEIAPHGPWREEQLKANKNLVARSNGLLPAINHEERYLTLGCGHTCAFCKHAAVGGPTPQESLKDEFGQVDVQKLKRNANFKTMIEIGWDWTIVPWAVDAHFPKFSKIAQKALNTANHVSTEVGELEAASTLADNLADAGQKSDWEEMAIENIISLNIPCSAYCKVLLEFVKLYSGGDCAPYVKFMYNFATQFQYLYPLGESYWTAVTQAKFASKLNMFPLIRVALLVANLSSDKKEDGICRFLSKQDVAKLTSKAKCAFIEACEDVLKDAMQIVSTVSSIEALMKPLGQLFVRIALHATSKGKHGQEGRDYSIDEAKQAFLKAISKQLDQTVTFDKWDVNCKDAETPSASVAAEALVITARVACLDDHSNPMWIAQQAGFQVGDKVIEKQTATSAETIYAIYKIEAVVALRQIHSYSDNLKSVEVKLEDFINRWQITKHIVPMQMSGGIQRPNSIDIDIQRSLIYKAVCDSDKETASSLSLRFWKRPDEVRTSQRIKEGAIKLVPLVPMSNISTKNTPTMSGYSVGKHDVCGESVEFFILPAARPIVDETASEFHAESIVAAFWWVATTANKAEANMEMDVITKNGINVPILTNTKALEPYIKLVRYKAPVTPTVQVAKPKAKGSEPASKKQKR